jgi:hypothetical protein
MRRGCFIGVIGVLVLCLVGCGLVWFVGIPRVRDSARDGIRDAISTEVAQQIPAGTDGTAEPGSYTLSAEEIQSSLSRNFDVQNVDDLVIRISPTGFEFGVTTEGGQETTYSGLPVVENGQLKMTNMKSSEGVLDFIFPAKDLGKAIEDAVNNYLAENNLQVDDIELTNGALTLVTVSA